MNNRFFDIIAAICMLDNVQWDEDFPDDEYCLTRTKKPPVEIPLPQVQETASLSIPTAG